MKVGSAQCVNKGMQRDASIDKASQEFAYENKNIRITTTGDNSFLSITNEKSTTKVPIQLELESSNVIYYDLEIQRSTNGMFDGIGNIISAKMVLSKPLTTNIHFILNIKSGTSDMAGTNVTARGVKDQTEINLLDYVPKEYLNTILALRIWKADDSPVYPVWIDHEITPTITQLGTVLGSTTINDKIILFTKLEETQDAIIVGEVIDESLKCTCLFIGDLNFNINHPIECITSYEADDVQKVYWVDGFNQPRVINICKTYDSSVAFDFSPSIPENVEVNIVKEYNGNGNFVSGIIQYFITFYNRFSSETNVAYESPLYYISPEDRGGKTDEIQTCSFKINIEHHSKEFEYARVYSLIRTSKYATPQAYIVEDVELNKEGITQVVDTGILNTPIAPTDIMFLGGNTITAETIEQKDNTLFLGNVNEVTVDVISHIKNISDKGTLSFGSKFILDKKSNNEYYPYSPNLDLSSEDIKTFKYLEWYKIGIQFQIQSGEWSSVVDLGNIQNTVKPGEEGDNTYTDSDYTEDGAWLPALKFVPSTALLSVLNKIPNIKNWRLVMAEHSPETRTIKAQGLVIPTLFNLRERANSTCYASPLWTLNTALYGEHLATIDVNKSAVEYHDTSDPDLIFSMYPFYHLPINLYPKKEGQYFKLFTTTVGSSLKQQDPPAGYYLTSIQPIILVDRDFGSAVDRFKCTIKLGVKSDTSDTVAYYEVLIYNDSAVYGRRRKELEQLSNAVIKTLWSDIWDKSLDSNLKVSDLRNIESSDTIFFPDEIPSGDSLRDDYGIYAGNDKTVVLNTYLRDIIYTKQANLINDYGNQYFLDANFCNFISPNINNINKGLKFRIVGYTDIINSISDYNINVEDSTIGTTTYTYPKYNLNLTEMSVWLHDKVNTGITSFPLWPYLNKLYYINYWHNSGNLVNDRFNLKNKTFANMWFCKNNIYTSPINYGNVDNLANVNNQTVLIDSNIYKSEYQNVLFPKTNTVSFIGGDNENGTLDKKPINASAPLTTVINAINATSSSSPLDEEVESLDAVNIKHKSSEHIVFKLPAEEGFFGILPNYTPQDKRANGFIYSNTIYPTGVKAVDYIFYISTPSKLTFKDPIYNGKVAVVVNNDKVKITSMNDAASSIWIEAEHDGVSEVQTHFENSGIINQPTFLRILEELKEVGTPDGIAHGEKRWFIRVKGINYNLILEIVGGYLLFKDGEGNITGFRVDATATVVNARSPIYMINPRNDRKYLLGSFYSGSTGSSYRLEELSIFYIPEIEDIKYSEEKPKLFIGEFYTDYDENTFFGGSSQNCKFVPISKAYPTSTTIGWGLEGDTYYQRYDNVRIYGANESDVNQNIDAVSFMLETYENLDGDYRTQRGRSDVVNLTVENTNNILNTVYSQPNDYTASYVTDEKFDDATHPTLYMWSLSKQSLADIDTWTAINLNSSLKLDGDKGELTKIKRWNNQLLAFQEKGLAVINFNQQTTISTSEGVPVEIANSGKVTGHYYISSTQGCLNKWSIVDSPYGLYFIDGYNKSINVFNSEGIKSLSTVNLFQDWTVENEKGIVWNPTNNGGFKSFYDPIHKEVYFANDKTALCYNELLGQFTSFYDYDKLNSLLPLNGTIYGIREGELHKMFEGLDYCNLFGKSVKYSMTYKVSKDTFVDKTWTNLEYRADIYDKGNLSDKNSSIINDTFDTLEVWNEYQKGSTNLKGNKYPNARCKFRVWRVDIPRDSIFRRDRIRNPWIMLKLEKTKDTNKRMEFHDLIVKYLQ